MGSTTSHEGERRLAAIETSLSPIQLVLRWLAEAHAYNDFNTYTEALFDQDPSNLPKDRLAREAQTRSETLTVTAFRIAELDGLDPLPLTTGRPSMPG